MSAATALAAPSPLTLTSDNFQLGADQDKAAKRINNFILDPDQKHLVLSGYAGTGKSTLLRHVFDTLPQTLALAKIVGDETVNGKFLLTATTNKAAGALRQTTGRPANTLHSELGLVLERDHSTGKQNLMETRFTREIRNRLIVIDEAFMSNTELLKITAKFTKESKILWVGDPAQLLPVGMNYAPLTIENFPEVSLKEIIRQQADSPIVQMATLARYAVETGRFFKFKPDGEIIKHVPRDVFSRLMLESFDEHYGHPGAVKVLSWTNKSALGWNAHVKHTMKGTMEISEGDYVVCNSAVRTDNVRLQTDETIQITGKQEAVSHGVEGHKFQINGKGWIFMPKSNDDKKSLLKDLKKDGSPEAMDHFSTISDTWADLRDEYACTINKSQGSTYGTVFIDLQDIGRCNMPNQLARLLYVSISRPRDRIVFTGDLRG